MSFGDFLFGNWSGSSDPERGSTELERFDYWMPMQDMTPELTEAQQWFFNAGVRNVYGLGPAELAEAEHDYRAARDAYIEELKKARSLPG